jgi:hypothetical protein
MAVFDLPGLVDQRTQTPPGRHLLNDDAIHRNLLNVIETETVIAIVEIDPRMSLHVVLDHEACRRHRFSKTDLVIKMRDIFISQEVGVTRTTRKTTRKVVRKTGKDDFIRLTRSIFSTSLGRAVPHQSLKKY